MNRGFLHRRHRRNRRVPGLMMRPGRRGLRCYSRLDCLARIYNRRHLVVHAVREKGIVPSMMVDLPSPLHLVVLRFRPVANSYRLFRLLTT